MHYDNSREFSLQNEVVDILVATPAGCHPIFWGLRTVFSTNIDIPDVLTKPTAMLEYGLFLNVKRIIRQCTPKEDRQTLLFKARRLTRNVLNLASNWTQGAEFVEIRAGTETAERVEQTV